MDAAKDLHALNVKVPNDSAADVCATKEFPQMIAAVNKSKIPSIFLRLIFYLQFKYTKNPHYKTW